MEALLFEKIVEQNMYSAHVSLKLLHRVPAAVHVSWPNTSSSVWSCHEDN